MSFSYIGKIGIALGSITKFPKNFLFGLIWHFIIWGILLLLAGLAIMPLVPALTEASSADPNAIGNVDMTPFTFFYIVLLISFMILKPMWDISSLAYASASTEEKNIGFLEFMDHAKARYISLLLANLIYIFSGLLAMILVILASSLILSLISSFSNDPVVQDILSFALIMVPFLAIFALFSLYLPFVFISDKKMEKGILGSFIQCIKVSLSSITRIFPLAILVFAWNYIILFILQIPFCIGSFFLAITFSFFGWYVFSYICIVMLRGKPEVQKEKEIKKPKRK